MAKLLLAAVEDQARQLGCCKLTLEVLEGNAVARSLYRACGFEGYELKAETQGHVHAQAAGLNTARLIASKKCPHQPMRAFCFLA